MTFRQIEEIGPWAEENGGIDGVRAAFAAGRFGRGTYSLNLVNEWLRIEDAVAQTHMDAKECALRIREVAASETAAESAKRSAASSRMSATWAFGAFMVALAALIISLLK